jgi:hypothetical protein
MLNDEEQQKSLEKLQRLIVGKKVIAVEKNDDEQFSLVVGGNGGVEEFYRIPIFSNDLGWWIEGEHAVDINLERSYLSAETMLTAMSEYNPACDEFDAGEEFTVLPIENVEKR